MWLLRRIGGMDLDSIICILLTIDCTKLRTDYFILSSDELA